jgi:hypothetical protein
MNLNYFHKNLSPFFRIFTISRTLYITGILKVQDPQQQPFTVTITDTISRNYNQRTSKRVQTRITKKCFKQMNITILRGGNPSKQSLRSDPVRTGVSRMLHESPRTTSNRPQYMVHLLKHYNKPPPMKIRRIFSFKQSAMCVPMCRC